MKISINMTRKDLFTFSVYNSFSGMSGLFNVIWTVVWIAAFVVSFSVPQYQLVHRFAMIFCAMLFTVIQPCVIWRRTGRQAKTDAFKQTIYLTLGEKILVEQAEASGEIEWKQVRKVVRLKSMYILDMGYGRAYLLPNASVEGREEELIAVLREKLPKTKMKGLKA